MKVTIDKINFWIRFQHNRIQTKSKKPPYNTQLSNFGGSTECFIETEGFNVIGKGKCTVYAKDRYIKEIGRNLSFERAIATLPNKELKTILTNAYLQRTS